MAVEERRFRNSMGVEENTYSKKLTSRFDELNFSFNDNDKTLDRTNLRYFAKGGITAVYKIKKDGGDDTQLILRVVSDLEDINDFIRKYDEDSILFGNNMIEIYNYGYIYDNNIDEANKIAPYVITKQYSNSNDIIASSDEDKMKLLKQLIDFNKLLDDNDYVYRDLKFDNIGFERTGEEVKFIVLDYDAVTLVKKDVFGDTEWYNVAMKGRYPMYRRYVYGTYPPVYSLGLFNRTIALNQVKNQINKMSSIGIAQIISKMFFSNTQIDTEFDRFINNIHALFTEHEPIDRTDFNPLKQIFMKLNTFHRDSMESKLFILMDRLTKLNYDHVPSPSELVEDFRFLSRTLIQARNKYILYDKSKPLHPSSNTYESKYLKYGHYEVSSLENIFHKKYILYDESKALHPSSNTYESKYLKYKAKYLNLKNTLLKNN